MDVEQIKNSLGMWLACIPMVIVLLIQAALFFKLAKKEAKTLNIPDDSFKSGIRSAAVTALGPTMASCIMLITLMAYFGSAIGWVKMCDIGAGRTELAFSSTAQSLYTGTDEAMKFAYALWGMAFLSIGWVVFALCFTSRMDAAVNWMNTKFDRKWIGVFMATSMIAMFSYTLANQVVGKNMCYYVGAFVSAGSMILLKQFVKNKHLKELSIAFAMIIGMIAATVCQYAMA